MKKKLLISLIAVLSAGLVLALGIIISRNLRPDVRPAAEAEIDSFQDAVDYADVGSKYVLDNHVRDTNGNIYRLDATVKTKEGTDVTLLKNSFTVLSTDGYQVSYLLEKDGTKYEKKVDVKTTGICLDEEEVHVKVGTKVSYPEVKFVVDSESVDETVEIKAEAAYTSMAAADMHNYSVKATEDSFTADIEGNFSLTYTATYKGRTFTSKKKYVAEKEYAANIVADYHSPAQSDTIGSVEKEYYGEFAGEKGCIKITSSGIWPQMTFQATHKIESYQKAGYNYIVFRMYFPKGEITWPGLAYGSPKGTHGSTEDELTTGVWKDYYFPADAFYKNWTNNGFINEARLYSDYSRDENGKEAEGAVAYISEIRMEKKPIVYTNIVADYHKASGSPIGGSGLIYEYLKEFEGEKGCMKITSKTTSWPQMEFVAKHPIQSYKDSGYNYIVFRMYFPEDGITWESLTCGAPKGTKASVKEELVRGEWKDYYISADAFYANWTDEGFINEARLYSDYSRDEDGNEVKGAVAYISEIRMEKKEEIPEPYTNIVANYHKKDASPIGGSGLTYEYVKEYAGETGCYKITSKTTSWPQMEFVAKHPIQSYKDSGYNYIVFRMYFPEDGITWESLTYGSPSGVKGSVKDKIVKGEWKDYYISADAFYANWKDGGFDNNARLYSNYSRDAEGKEAKGAVAYISEIRMEKLDQIPEIPEETTNIVADFHTKDASPIGGSGTAHEWLTEFAGEKGCMKLTTSGVWPQVEFVAKHKIQSYKDAGYKYIVFRMYFPESGATWQSLTYGSPSGTKASAGKLVKGEWKDYYVSADAFFANWTDGGFINNARIYSGESPAGAVAYISEIRMEKEKVKEVAANIVADYHTEDGSPIGGSGTAHQWMESFAGEKGCMKLTTSGVWPQVEFVAEHKMQSYKDAGYKYIVFRMYFPEDADTWESLVYGLPNGKKASAGRIVKGEWKDYYISADAFYENWTDDGFIQGARIYSGESPQGAVAYISEIRMEKHTDIVYDFQVGGSEYYVNPKGGTHELISNFEGEKGCYKITYNNESGAWPKFVFAKSSKAYKDAGYKYIVLRMYFPTDGYTASSVQLISDTGEKSDRIATEKGKWKDYYFPASVFYSNTKSNEVTIDFGGIYNGNQEVKGAVIYISEIRMANKKKAAENIVADFHTEDGSPIGGSGTSHQWMESFAGEKGCMKLTTSGVWPQVEFVSEHKIQSYKNAGYQYIVFRMYFPETGATWTPGLLYGNAKGNVAAGERTTAQAIVRGEWKDYYFLAEPFFKNWTDTGFGANCKLFTWESPAGAVAYISEIRMEKTMNVVWNKEANGNTCWINQKGGTIKWMDEVSGEKNCLQVTYNNTAWPKFVFATSNKKFRDAGYDYIVLRMYFPDSGTTASSVQLKVDNTTVKSDRITVEKGKWKDYYFPASVFYSAASNNEVMIDFGGIYNGNQEVKGATVYISEIRMERKKAVEAPETTSLFSLFKDWKIFQPIASLFDIKEERNV